MRPPLVTAMSARELDEVVLAAWRRVQRELERRLLDYEADINASMYCHLRQALGDHPSDYVVLIDMKWTDVVHHRRPDIGILQRRPESSLLVAFEFKWLFGGRVGKHAVRDVRLKMRRYADAGVRRGYFCFVSEGEDMDSTRRTLDDCASWAAGRDFLVFAEGFFYDKEDGWRKAREPWTLRLV